MKTLYFLLFVTFFNSCTSVYSVKNEQKDNNKSQVQLEFKGSVDFITDTSTSPNTDCLHYKEIDGENLFLILNSHDNSICIFNYEDKNQIKKITYEQKGNHGVGKIQGFYYHNHDSIFVYSYWGGFLYLTNSFGEVLDKYLLIDRENRTGMWYPAPYIQTTSPISKIGNNIVVNGFLAGEERPGDDVDRPVTISVNLQTKALGYSNQYPDYYRQHNWGGGMTYRLVYYTPNNNDEMVLSFTADHSIFVYSFADNSTHQYYAGSNLIDKITSLDHPKDRQVSSRMEWDWYMQNPSYEGIFFDPYKKLYYRIARLPVKNYTKNSTGNNKPIVVIILDADFNYIGEYLLPKDKKYFPGDCFVSEKGLHIGMESKYEDNLSFDIYNVISL